MDKGLEIAVFGGGCFWCTEAIFTRLKGVESVVSGYAGGTSDNPTYEQVSAGNTNYAEAIQIQFDSAIVEYKDLLNVFFATHNPTTLNQQGNDIGTQYRSAIFYTTDTHRSLAELFIKELTDSKTFDNPIVTEVVPLVKFWPAESYHQRYYELNESKPYCSFVISPKIAKLREKFAPLLKSQ